MLFIVNNTNKEKFAVRLVLKGQVYNGSSLLVADESVNNKLKGFVSIIFT